MGQWILVFRLETTPYHGANHQDVRAEIYGKLRPGVPIGADAGSWSVAHRGSRWMMPIWFGISEKRLEPKQDAVETKSLSHWADHNSEDDSRCPYWCPICCHWFYYHRVPHGTPILVVSAWFRSGHSIGCPRETSCPTGLPGSQSWAGGLKPRTSRCKASNSGSPSGKHTKNIQKKWKNISFHGKTHWISNVAIFKLANFEMTRG